MLNLSLTRLFSLMILLLISGSIVLAQDKTPLRSTLPQAPVKTFQGKKSPKLSSELSGLRQEFQASPQPRQANQEKINLLYKDYLMIRGEQVLVELIAENNPETLLADMAQLNFEEVATYQRVISGWLNMEAIDQLDNINSLRFARAVRVPQKDIGSVTSQGDLAQGSSEAREAFGVDGTGVTVGVLSDSYDFLRGADDGIASGDLPGPGNPEGYEQEVEVLLDADIAADLNPAFGYSDEGRAMLEIVHDVAPGAGLAFHTAFLGQPSFASGILRLEDEAGCDVIVDDIIYFEEPFFQDGIIAQAADEVSRRGATFLSAAGNRERQSYESAFRPSASIYPLGTDPATFGAVFIIGDYMLHDFDPGPGVDYFQKVTFPGNLNLSFQWDNAYASACTDCPGAESDLDIFIALREDDFNSMHTLGINANVGGDPIEAVGAVSDFPQEVYIVIGKWLGASGPNPNPTTIKYVDYGSGLPTEHPTYSATVVGHKNAEGAIAVGAVPYFLTPAFGFPDPVLEGFSSAGGTPIFYDQHGNRTSKVVREKPEVCGPDGGNTSFFSIFTGDIEGDGFPNFFGTSASSPHVAGVAALLQEAAGNGLNPEQVETLLTHTALDMDDPFTPGFDAGFDYGTGYGFVRTGEALEKAINSQRITRLVLVDATTDTDLRPLKEGDRILLSDLGTTNLAIRAETEPGLVGSVKIMISGALNTEQTENTAPYASFGDNNGDYFGKNFALGSYSVKAVPYSGSWGGGQMGLPLQISFQLIEEVESFTLIDASVNLDIENLSLYNVIFPTDFDNQLNIRANTSSDGKVGSVKFVLRAMNFVETFKVFTKIENSGPFSLFGDKDGDYFAGRLESGLYVLEATPYSGQNAGGTPGERLSVILDVFNFGLDQPAARMINVYPNPISNQKQLQVNIKNAASEKAHFTLLNIRGETLYEAEEYMSGSINPATLSINELNLQPGVYFLRVTLPHQEVQTVRLLKE